MMQEPPQDRRSMPSWSRLGGILGPSWGHVCHLGAALGPSWSHLGPSWGHLGAMLDHRGPILGHLGAILGHLGAVLGHFGAVLGHLGPSCGRSWGSSWAVLRPSSAILGPPWGHLRRARAISGHAPGDTLGISHRNFIKRSAAGNFAQRNSIRPHSAERRQRAVLNPHQRTS